MVGLAVWKVAETTGVVVPDEPNKPKDPPCVKEGAMTFPAMPPLAATDRMLDNIDSAAVTGHTVVERSRVSVINTVLIPSGNLVRSAVAFLTGQLVTVGAQLTAVRIEVDRTVKVVKASPVEGV